MTYSLSLTKYWLTSKIISSENINVHLSVHFFLNTQMVSAQTCPQGWTFHGGHCYTLSTEHKVTWSAANRACRERYTWSSYTFCVLNYKQTLRETDAESIVIPSIFFPSCLFDVRYKGTLASVLSKVDMDWLWNFSGRKPFWIGGYLQISLFLLFYIFRSNTSSVVSTMITHM